MTQRAWLLLWVCAGLGMFGFGAWKSISARSPRSVVSAFCSALAAGDSAAVKELMLSSAIAKPTEQEPAIADAKTINSETPDAASSVSPELAADAAGDMAAWEKHPDLKFYISRLTVADQRAVAIVDLTIAGETLPVVIQLARSPRHEWKIAGLFRPDAVMNSLSPDQIVPGSENGEPTPSPSSSDDLRKSSPAEMDRLAIDIEAALKQAAIERAAAPR